MTANIFLRQDATFAAIAQGDLPFDPSPLQNSLGADVALNNVSNYFDGPNIAQGSVGTWFVSGQVSVEDTTSAASINCKLWDGTTVIDSAFCTTPAANSVSVMAVSGFITNPAGSLKISVQDTSHTTGKILFNASGNSRDSSIVAFRIK